MSRYTEVRGEKTKLMVVHKVKGCIKQVGTTTQCGWEEKGLKMEIGRKQKPQQFLKVVPLEFIQSLKLGCHVLFQRDTLRDFLCVSQIVKRLPLFYGKQSVQKNTYEEMP